MTEVPKQDISFAIAVAAEPLTMPNPLAKAEAELDRLHSVIEVREDALRQLTAELDRLRAENEQLLDRIDGHHRMFERMQQAYLERNHVVAALAHLFPSGTARTAIEGWHPEWNGCVYIDLPSGQVSYHYHDSHAHLFAGLPPYEQPWDGHDKDTVHARLRQMEVK